MDRLKHTIAAVALLLLAWMACRSSRRNRPEEN